MTDAPVEPLVTPHVVRGMDSLRFVAAAVVAGGHGVWMPLDGITGPTSSTAMRAVSALWGNWLNGGFAVCAFFIISGFCIHYPQAGAGPITGFSRAEFLIKRFVRICIPIVVVVLLTWWLTGTRSLWGLRGVLWTVGCELVYYALYPFLLPLLKARWRVAVAVSAVISLAMLALWPGTEEPGYFRWWAWLFSAPAWLLGALLAERYRSGALARARFPSIWLLRAALPLAAIASNIAYYHLPVHIPMTWSIAAFVPLGYVWIAAEVQRLGVRPPWAWLERLGLATYSMYLLHKLAIDLFHLYARSLPLWLFHLGMAAALGIGTWLLYTLVEAPAHRLAKWLGARWRGRRSPKTGFPDTPAEPMRAAQEI